jgi:hypothetical protein
MTNGEADKARACIQCGGHDSWLCRTTKGANPGRNLRLCGPCLRTGEWYEFGPVDREPLAGERDIPRDRLACLLASGMEGGIGYWARIDRYKAPHRLADPFAGLTGFWRSEVFKHIHYPLCQDGDAGVWLASSGEDWPETCQPYLTHAALLRGLETMARDEPRHFGDFLAKNDDATTADVFIQCCVFGKVIFG